MNRRARLARRILRDHRDPDRYLHVKRTATHWTRWRCPHCPLHPQSAHAMLIQAVENAWEGNDRERLIMRASGPLASGQWRLRQDQLPATVTLQITPEMADQMLRQVEPKEPAE